MKTTLELPDDLIRKIKIRAVNENRKLKDVVADLLRRGLAAEEARASEVQYRVQTPLIKGGHPAPPGQELTPDRVSEILLEQEIENLVSR